jgi:predicted nucleic acid-binding Zn ribbon protein
MPKLKGVPSGPSGVNIPTWDKLPQLQVIFTDGYKFYKFGDDDIDDELTEATRRLLKDSSVIGPPFINDFMEEMSERCEDILSDRQVRAILNTISGSIRANRKRFYRSRDYRRDRYMSDDNCIVCGAPLSGQMEIKRGCGKTCYMRILQEWIY